nr:GDSL-type esterase/lipase family protein [uncultured Acetatifactor sp.]
MKWLKKWFYLILLVGMGIIYLTCVDKWQVYAESVQTAKNWYENLRQGDVLLADGAVDSMAEGMADADSDGGDAGGQPGADGEGNGSPDGSGAEGETVESGTQPGQPAGGDTAGVGQMPPSGENGEQGGGPAGTSAPNGESGEPSGENPPAEGPENPPEGSGGQGGDAPSEPAEPKEVAYMTVEDDYFADAVFIGDSRTMGMFEYGGLEETAAFYCSTGLTVYKMFDSEIVPAQNGKITVEEALQQNSFAKIYLCIGINEMGTGTVESFLEAYQEAVDHLRELQPDAIIYLQAIIKVTTERSGQGDYITNEGIAARNEGIALMADNEHVFFLDVNPLICDETGGMVPEYTFDGVHLMAQYIDIWKDFLKSHAIALP